MVSTIKDIAKATGVSIATVSRVINELGCYSPEVERKVQQAIKELGYRRNVNARSLVSNSSKIIGIVMPDVATSYYGDIVSGIEDEANVHGYNVILTHAGVEGNRLHESLEMMSERRVDGLIIFSLALEEQDIAVIIDLNIPVLLIATEVAGSQIPYIKVDDYAASYAAVEYLIQHGHSKIGLAGVNQTDPIAGVPRIQGYKDALFSNGIVFDNKNIQYGDFSFDAGKKAMDTFSQLEDPITAVFCVSDETALGIISRCYEIGWSVPDDISVIGYDNSKISYMSSPPISTIAQPFYEMGKKGCSRLILSIGTKEKIHSEIIPFELVERASVKTL